MSYIDYYLRAPSQEAFEAARPEEVDGALDVIGEITIDGVVIEGYHANLRLRDGVDVPYTLKPFLIDAPTNPVRVFA